MSHQAVTPLSRAGPSIPDYELLRPIGRGAYGEVWLARNVTGSWVALKIVHRAAFDHDRPFEREFEGIKRFEPISRSDPSQVAILHVGLGDGFFYYVMELADDVAVGRDVPIAPRRAEDSPPYQPKTLKRLLNDRGHLPSGECLAIALSLTRALAHLHENGLVHRDVKPSNVIFVKGQAKLADIGLVTSVDATRSFVGTEGYLPPEGAGTLQADLYSLGKVLYEMSTGCDRKEFPALPPDIATRADRDILAELNAVVVRACQLDPRERYKSAEEMHTDLALLQRGESVKAKRVVERRLGIAKRMVLAGLVMAAVAIPVVLWNERILRATGLAYPSLVGDRRGTKSTEAWNLYQQGRFFAEKGSADDVRKAIEYFQRASDLDPKFARAYAGLGKAYCELVFDGYVPAREYFGKAEANHHRALELGPSLAEAWSGLGYIKTKYGWDLAEAERLCQHGVELDPSSTWSLLVLAICFGDQGKVDKAIALHERLLKLYPVSLNLNRSLGLRLFQARRYKEAIAAFQKTVELHPNYAKTWRDLGAVLQHVGRDEDAVRALSKFKLLSGVSESDIEALKEECAQIGVKAFWRKEAIRPGNAGTNYVAALTAAMNCTRAEDYEGAIQWLQKLPDDPFEFPRAMLSPVFDPLRADPRFQALVERLRQLDRAR